MPRFQFQSPFDSTAYQQAKAKGNGPSDEKPASGTKPNHSKRGKGKSTTGTSSTVSMNVSEEFPPIETLLPMDEYDLTAEEGALVRLPKSTCQQATQATQEQATQGQPTQGQPSREQPTPEQPSPEQPAPGQPAPGQPAPGQPAPGQPAQGQPAQGQPAQGQPTQGQATPAIQGQATQEAQAAQEIEDGNVQGNPLYPLDLVQLLIPSRQGSRHSWSQRRTPLLERFLRERARTPARRAISSLQTSGRQSRVGTFGRRRMSRPTNGRRGRSRYTARRMGG